MFGTDAHFLVDLFLLTLLVVLPTMFVGVAMVRRGKIKAHVRIMGTCFALFVAAVAAFEIQVHFGEPGPPLARVPLVIHLCFAIPGLLLWAWQILRAKDAFADPATHRKRGRAVLGLITATVGTGIWLYLETF